jgi:Fe2+ or Zn2+ uptake regulation protein
LILLRITEEFSVIKNRRLKMIDREYGKFVLVCDICGKEIDGFEDFHEAVKYKKENGWKSEKYKGEWQDVCPECQEG